MKTKTTVFVIAASCTLLLNGCSTWDKLNNTEKGAAIGVGSGALIGGAAGDAGGALLGGAAGGVAGGVIGHEIDEDEKEDRHHHHHD